MTLPPHIKLWQIPICHMGPPLYLPCHRGVFFTEKKLLADNFFLLFVSDMLPSSIRGAMLCGLLLLALTATVTLAEDDDGDDDDDNGGIPKGNDSYSCS